MGISLKRYLPANLTMLKINKIKLTCFKAKYKKNKCQTTESLMVKELGWMEYMGGCMDRGKNEDKNEPTKLT